MEVNIEEIFSGLYYAENLETPNIIEKLDELKWEPLSASKNSRVVQHYGFKYNYKTHNINEKTQDIPEFLNTYNELLTDICKELILIDDDYIFNQCIINNYKHNQGISAHIDVKSYGSVIGCYTLCSDSVMIFRNGSEKIELNVKPNSLYIMSGDSRYKWTHEMMPNKNNRRISLTFRNVSNAK